MRARLVQPEHRRVAGDAGASDGELDPVLDRDVLGLAHAPDVAGADLVLHERLAGLVDDAHGAGSRNLEGLVVAAVLLGRLRHEADVGHGAHRGRVVGAVSAAVVDDDLVDAGVAAVGMTARQSASLPSGPHMWPEVRIIAGIEASTIVSLGTCRLVMPLRSSTMASRGPLSRPSRTARSMAKRARRPAATEPT